MLQERGKRRIPLPACTAFAAVQGTGRVGGMYLKGIFTRTRTPKMVAHVVRETWTRSAAPPAPPNAEGSTDCVRRCLTCTKVGGAWGGTPIIPLTRSAPYVAGLIGQCSNWFSSRWRAYSGKSWRPG